MFFKKNKKQDKSLKIKVLVMDDEKDVRDTVGDMLKILGCTVVLTSNGEDAVKRYKNAFKDKKPFDTVIMDLNVPMGMGGREAAARILKINPSAHMIVSSGYVNDPVMARPEKYGFKEVLKKPYTLADMKKALQKISGS